MPQFTSGMVLYPIEPLAGGGANAPACQPIGETMLFKVKLELPIEFRGKSKLYHNRYCFEYVEAVDEKHAMSEAYHMVVGHPRLTDNQIEKARPVWARPCKPGEGK